MRVKLTKAQQEEWRYQRVLDGLDGLGTERHSLENWVLESCTDGYENTWKDVRAAVEQNYELLTKTGKPRRGVADMLEKGRKLHAKARREYLTDEKAKAAHQEWEKAIARGEDKPTADRKLRETLQAL